MRSSTVVALMLAAAAAGAAAWVVGRGGPTGPGDAASALALPGLSGRVNDVASLTVKKGDAEFTLARRDGQWGLASKGGYPAKFEAVKSAIVGLSELKQVEAKTSRAESYSKIGVQDPGTPAANPAATGDAPATEPTLVTLKDDKGEVMAALILGTQKWGQTPQVFIRRAGEAQAWLAEGRVDVPGEELSWLDRQILNIPRERVRTATVTHPDGSVVAIARADQTDATFTVHGVPAGRELTSPSAGDSLGASLAYVSMDDVAPAAEAGFGDAAAADGVQPGPRTVFELFDGTVITMRTLVNDGKTWATFAVEHRQAATPEPLGDDAAAPPTDAAGTEAAEMHARLAPWAFAIPEYKAKAMTSTLESLLKPAAAEPPPAPVPAAPETEAPTRVGPVLPPGPG